MPRRWLCVFGQPDPFCEAVTEAELHPAKGTEKDYTRRCVGIEKGVGWLVADQAADLWECPVAPLLGESVGKLAESWHAMTRPELVTECQANVKHMVVIQLLGRKLKVHTELRTAPELPLLSMAAAPRSYPSFLWLLPSRADGLLNEALATGELNHVVLKNLRALLKVVPLEKFEY